MAVSANLQTRRTLQAGDLDRIVDLHRRVYVREYGMNDTFLAGVRRGLEQAAARGWPEKAGAAWLVGDEGTVDGSLGLTHEAGGVGRVRVFVLDPALRGRGLGAAMLEQLLAQARSDRLDRLELETFSDLTVAARLYRDAGFRLTWERPRSDWGRPISYQGYELELR